MFRGAQVQEKVRKIYVQQVLVLLQYLRTRRGPLFHSQDGGTLRVEKTTNTRTRTHTLGSRTTVLCMMDMRYDRDFVDSAPLDPVAIEENILSRQGPRSGHA